MEFDSYTVVLLEEREDAPKLDEAASDALQDAHMAYLDDLHAAGHLPAAGPLMGGPAEPFRGLGLFRAGPEEARELLEADPAVRAGRYSVRVLPWMVPAGAVEFAPVPFPRSVAQAFGGN